MQPQPIDTTTIRSAYQGMPGHLAVDRLCDEVERLRADAMAKAHRAGELGAEVDRLRAIEEWARDADHHPGCSGGYGAQYRCKCGRRDLFPERWADA